MAIEEAAPGLAFPESASRVDLARYLQGLDPANPNDDREDLLGVGVRNPPPLPSSRGGAEASLAE